ncbi:carboxyl-terminal processing protease CtpB [Kamptonema sp. UHCC 0994]|uniref:carboxyl-terminal processing protease CtpB n=1 Tax=Kamptonema sp. UHCC 0994 TaxID=3031329 RepID=UPI0023BA0D04|nr:carboxyl-terminal processing protease CtpB [Kamptonema sp. UHCC 0994]MDF0552258.1 S41 family peptidase [Kamptonema sp. UHCC 0994]
MNLASRRFSKFRTALLSGAIATTASISLFVPGLSQSVRAALQDSPKAVLDEAWQIVNRDFVDPSFNKVDWQAARQQLLNKNYTSREEAYSALRKALEKLNDPYTRFMDPKQYEALTNQTSGELTGVGMRLEQDEKTKTISVAEPMEDSPAIRAGIQAGDQILGIDGKSTEGMTVGDAAGMIRGSEGTKVTLKIGRTGKSPFEVTLTRARIEVAAVRYTLKEEGKTRVGYIRLQEFSAHAGEQMQKAIKKLKDDKVDAFVLDLRGNPGGLLRVSIDIARMWMNTGAIVRTVDREGGSEEMRANRTAIADQPLVVLVDDNSASASEILAGALKDNKRATVMGGQTFGKALVQSVHSLSDGSGLAVTIAHYYTPNGIDISHKGVTPDIKVDVTDEQKLQLASKPSLVATQNDPCYARAIALLKTNPSARPLAANEIR